MNPPRFVARHGETSWNREKRLQGRGDSPLTERGHAQARALAELAARLGIERVVASPLGRARVTAEMVVHAAGASLELAGALAEIDFGHVSGMTLDEAERAFPGLSESRRNQKWTHAWPGGESYANVTERVERWLEGEPLNPRLGRTLVVAHQTVNRVLLVSLGAATIAEVLQSEQPSDVVIRISLGAVHHTHSSPPQAAPRSSDRPQAPGAQIEWVAGLFLPTTPTPTQTAEAPPESP